MPKKSELNPAFAITWGAPQVDLDDVLKSAFRGDAGENRLNSLLYELAGSAQSARDTLQEWAQRFVTDPAYYFEWSDAAMIAAAEHKFTLDLIYLIQRTPAATIESVSETLNLEALRRAQYFNGSSSSASTNVMKRLEMNLTARWADRVQSLARRVG